MAISYVRKNVETSYRTQPDLGSLKLLFVLINFINLMEHLLDLKLNKDESLLHKNSLFSF